MSVVVYFCYDNDICAFISKCSSRYVFELVEYYLKE